MPNTHRNRVIKGIVSILFLALSLLNMGTGAFAAPNYQEQVTSTERSAQTDSTPPAEIQPTSTPLPAATQTGSAPATGTVATGAVPQSTVNDLPPSPARPLPALFASGAYAQNQLVVRFKPSTGTDRIDECFQGDDIQVLSEIEELNSFVLAVPPEKTADLFYRVLDCRGALYVEPNFLLQAADTLPNDPAFGLQYGLQNIRAPQGWDLTTGSAAVTIAIVDTGVDYGHPDLAGKLVAGYDFVNNDNNPQDDNGHGTHVAGIAAALSNNGTGVAGVSWGARIMPVKVLNAGAGGTYADTAAGVVWAVDHGAQVINLSLGGTGPSAVLEDAIRYAHGKGALVVAAAGNAGANFVLYPARYPNVIAVARTDSADHWSGSNYGPEVDLSAPGSAIYSTVIGGYDTRSGSSMSTGFVSGLAAILMGVPGNASPDVIESQMETAALDIEFPGWDDYTGAGLIQVDAAIQLAVQSVLPTASPTNPSGSAGSTSNPVAATNSPLLISTWTASPTLVTQTVTATLTFEPGPTIATTGSPIASASPAGSADEVHAQGEAGNLLEPPSPAADYLLPCAGLALIALGLLLLLAFRKK